jgi:hypothetical protein
MTRATATPPGTRLARNGRLEDLKGGAEALAGQALLPGAAMHLPGDQQRPGVLQRQGQRGVHIDASSTADSAPTESPSPASSRPRHRRDAPTAQRPSGAPTGVLGSIEVASVDLGLHQTPQQQRQPTKKGSYRFVIETDNVANGTLTARGVMTVS